MGLVLAILALIWAAGGLAGLTRQRRAVLTAGVYGMVVAGHLLLPDGHALRAATGESAAPWLLLAGALGLVLAYRQGLQALRRRARPAKETIQGDGPVGGQGDDQGAAQPLFTETELNRYARHITLREVGGPGQKALKSARVLVIGAGGLGAPVLQYLAAAGVGTIGVIDDDVVENTNLQRQVIHPDSAIGTPKVFSAQTQMQAQNPFVRCLPYHRRLTPEIAKTLMADFDLVLDGSDNFETRYLVNRTAVALGVPLVSGALSQWEGQLGVFDPARGGPCYRCVFDHAPAAGLAPSCAEAGVIGPLPGVIGTMMAVEAIKLLTGAGAALRGQLYIYDALYGESRTITMAPRDDCPICGPSCESGLSCEKDIT